MESGGGGGGGGTGGVVGAAAAAAHYNPRTVEEVFRDFKGRRTALIKALTTGFSLSLSLTFFFSLFRLRYYCSFDRYGMSFSLFRECASSLSLLGFLCCCCCCELRNRKRFFFA